MISAAVMRLADVDHICICDSGPELPFSCRLLGAGWKFAKSIGTEATVQGSSNHNEERNHLWAQMDVNKVRKTNCVIGESKAGTGSLRIGLDPDNRPSPNLSEEEAYWAEQCRALRLTG
jgi:hypothetical protein